MVVVVEAYPEAEARLIAATHIQVQQHEVTVVRCGGCDQILGWLCDDCGPLCYVENTTGLHDE